MIIGILRADDVHPTLAERYGEYPAMIEALLRSSAKRTDIKLDFKSYHAHQRQLPQDIDETDAYIITGSKFSVNDNDLWIDELGSFVRLLRQARKPLVGICFGHQLIAVALGGQCEEAGVGWGIGIRETDVHAELKQTPDSGSFKVVYSHRDQVTKEPNGFKVIAGDEFCPIAACQFEDTILTLQGHPEFSTEFAQDLYKIRREWYPEPVYHAAMKSLRLGSEQQLLGDWILKFLAAPR